MLEESLGTAQIVLGVDTAVCHANSRALLPVMGLTATQIAQPANSVVVRTYAACRKVSKPDGSALAHLGGCMFLAVSLCACDSSPAAKSVSGRACDSKHITGFRSNCGRRRSTKQ